ncbi:sugar ABC transporter ATP-binding protein [Bradyrhizobium sp. LMTR 3]|uniref:sugar ABC transporter ATP-binding protein n=1 Tax=Bradyrhizobium sp. LMTR 3 TaxID=189873 RepID=UPI00159F0E96|nr:sugar ABC transporter ATP-binding protein [Bradyrhizobium sp. LMTR 3]
MKALRGVDLDVHPGETLAVVGENGAGKSTLMKILSGAVEPSGGELRIDGEPVRLSTPQEARSRGISTIYQELMIAPALTVLENVFLSDLRRGRFGLLDWDGMRREAQRILARLGFPASVDTTAKELSVAELQLIEIAKSLIHRSRLIIMDEPTASLAKEEVDNLFRIVRELKSEGIAIIFITHHLHEIFEICDRAVVLRDGSYVGQAMITSLTEDKLVTMMLGHAISEVQQRSSSAVRENEVVLSIKDLRRSPDLQGINLRLRRGEILGIAGLMGAGRTELVRAIFGADRVDSGEMQIKGKVGMFASPRAALDAGVGLAPEDRKSEGLILSLPIGQNITLPSLGQYAGMLGLRLGAERRRAGELSRQLNVKMASLDQLVGNLSGGNQQKVVLAKLVGASADIYLLDEPTRGIDIGAKESIFDLIWQLTEKGASVIVISSAINELLRVCDTIACMHLGRIIRTFERADFDLNAIMLSIMGKTAGHTPNHNDSRLEAVRS